MYYGDAGIIYNRFLRVGFREEVVRMGRWKVGFFIEQALYCKILLKKKKKKRNYNLYKY